MSMEREQLQINDLTDEQVLLALRLFVIAFFRDASSINTDDVAEKLQNEAIEEDMSWAKLTDDDGIVVESMPLPIVKIREIVSELENSSDAEFPKNFNEAARKAKLPIPVAAEELFLSGFVLFFLIIACRIKKISKTDSNLDISFQSAKECINLITKKIKL